LLHFSIAVPALGDYRHRIMVVMHRKDMHYPAWIDAEVFRAHGMAGLKAALEAVRKGSLLLLGEAEEKKQENRADNYEEFIDLVRKVLRSPYVVSVAQSLIARALDVQAGREAESFPAGDNLHKLGPEPTDAGGQAEAPQQRGNDPDEEEPEQPEEDGGT
jgi:hypothetical protein